MKEVIKKYNKAFSSHCKSVSAFDDLRTELQKFTDINLDGVFFQPSDGIVIICDEAGRNVPANIPVQSFISELKNKDKLSLDDLKKISV